MSHEINASNHAGVREGVKENFGRRIMEPCGINVVGLPIIDRTADRDDYKSVALPTELYRHGIYQGVEFHVLEAFSATFLNVDFNQRPSQSLLWFQVQSQ